MRSKEDAAGRRLGIIVVAVTLALTGVVVSSPARAVLPKEPYRPPLQGARIVHVGGGELRNEIVGGLEAQLQVFYPERLQVHRGDTVEWRFAPGFATMHTVTFLPGDMEVAAHPEPLESAHEPVIRDDEVPGSLALSESLMRGSDCGLIFPSELDGREAQAPCKIDDTTHRYSSQLSDALLNIDSAQPQGFAAEIDLPPGAYRYHCVIHPTMHGEIEVVERGADVPTQAEVDAAAREAIERDRQAAVELHRRLSVPRSVVDGDSRVWDVHVGAESADGRVALADYLPAELEVKAGDRVRFLARGSEMHTATFPMEAVGSFTMQGCDTSSCEGDMIPTGSVLLVAPLACEYDAPAGGAPAAPIWVPTRGCAGSGYLEWQLGAQAVETVSAPGGEVRTTATYHSSGFMISEHQPEWFSRGPNGRRWVQEFSASFPSAGTFTYACLIHTGEASTSAIEPSRSGMVGTVRVRPA